MGERRERDGKNSAARHCGINFTEIARRAGAEERFIWANFRAPFFILLSSTSSKEEREQHVAA